MGANVLQTMYLLEVRFDVVDFNFNQFGLSVGHALLAHDKELGLSHGDGGRYLP